MIWLALQQLEEIGVSRGILARNRHEWKWRETSVRGRNGKAVKEVLLESLPERFQAAYLRINGYGQTQSSLTTEETSSPAVKAEETTVPEPQEDDGERRMMQALVRYPAGLRDLMLAEAQRLAGIVARFDATRPKRQRSANGIIEYVDAVERLCDETPCTVREILDVEPNRAKRRSPHALAAWSKQMKQDGLGVFLRKPPKATGQLDGRKAEISAAAVEWLNANWRKKPSPYKLYQALTREARKHSWKIPAYGWVYRRYKDLPAIVSTLTFEGEKAYQGRLSPFLPRTVADLAALQILCGDHSVRDVSVMLPSGELTRPWLTIWYDLRTGLIWGWHLDLVPSSVTIGLAYANGVQNFGAQPTANPETGYSSYLYTDQGRDYRSKTLTGQDLVFRQAAKIDGGLNALCVQRRVGFMDELGIKHIMARGYNAKEKPVERVHKDISAWEQNAFEAEYCGNGKTDKPESWVRAWHRHQKLLKRADGNRELLESESPFMTLDSYRDNLAGWIVEYNNSKHTRATLGGSRVVPQEEYERLYHTKYEIAEDALALLLMKAARRKLGKNGIQMHQPHWFYTAEEFSEFKGGGHEIEIRYSDGDYSRLWAVLPDGRVVEAQLVTPSSILNPNKRSMEMIQRQKAHERKVVKEFRFIQESNYRGETAEDRVADLINPDEPHTPEAQKLAVNAQPTVRQLTRLDRTAARPREITAADVDASNVVEGLFGTRESEPKRPAIKDEWED